jgi:hypothetical protein
MKLSRFIRMQLLLLFALLQCVAPVAHAHVNGHHADQHVHLAYLDQLDLTEPVSGLPHFAVEADHSSVVSMPPQYRSADLTVEQAVDATVERLTPLREYAAQQFVSLPRQTLPFFPYQHPCSQAPPA